MMRRVNYSEELELEVYHEKLDNGLEVYLVPMKNKDKYYLTYATHYGSTTTTFTKGDSKKEVTVPNGIAHFLEHKMFEQENGEDPFEFFAKSGTDANASTDYDLTRYIASGTKNFKENLRYLIKYVNEPYFTDENVEKEKGIIAQEINMYKDEAEYAIEDSIRECTYHNDNHRIDIAGEVEDIKKITKEDLYLCYNNFYSPRNMFLLVVGKFDVEDAKQIINEELVPLKNKTETLPQIKEIIEPPEVKTEYLKVPFNITIPKMMVSIKTERSKFKLKDNIKLDLYLNIICNILFGSSSLFREKATNNNLITKFYTEIESVKKYNIIYLFGESTNPDELLNKIREELQNINITEEDLERYKKVLIANEIKQADYVDGVTINLTTELQRYGKAINNPIEIYRSLNMKELNEVLKSINIDNQAVVIYVPKNMPSYN